MSRTFNAIVRPNYTFNTSTLKTTVRTNVCIKHINLKRFLESMSDAFKMTVTVQVMSDTYTSYFNTLLTVWEGKWFFLDVFILCRFFVTFTSQFLCFGLSK